MLFIARLSRDLADGIKRKAALLGGLSNDVGVEGFEPPTLCL